MASYFLDTSALIKRYIAEPGHAWVGALCDPAAGHEIHISQIAHVEVVATLCRMVRERPPRLRTRSRDNLIALFRAHLPNDYIITPVTEATFARAADLCLTHPLRAYDAVQLASALAVRDAALAVGVAPPTFVCADVILLGVAAAEGLATENPSAHP